MTRFRKIKYLFLLNKSQQTAFVQYINDPNYYKTVCGCSSQYIHLQACNDLEIHPRARSIFFLVLKADTHARFIVNTSNWLQCVTLQFGKVGHKVIGTSHY